MFSSAPESSLSRSPVPVEAIAAAKARAADQYDGEPAGSLARRLAVPRLALYASIGSTMDAAHALGAAGAPSGTLVLADEQTAGRGRQGRVWLSAPGTGIWLTLLVRPADESGLEVLSLRVGLAAARALDEFATDSVRVKWPNDLYVGSGKLGGILVEARWRSARPEWVAVGIGVNVSPPRGMPSACGLRQAPSRLSVLEALVPAIRVAADRSGVLSAADVDEYAARDFARGRACVSPAAGIVEGVSAAGALLVRTPGGIVQCRAGSLVLEGEQ